MKTLIVIKHSKYEWEKIKDGISHDDLIAKYSREGANLDAIMAGHACQMAARDAVLSAFYDADACFMHNLSHDIADTYDLVIVLGGDNSFTKVSHCVHKAIILGVNSDPQRSSGHLTRWKINELADAFDLRERLDFNEYKVEAWTRLGAVLDGELIIPATSEYFIGERLRDQMSRHVLVYDGEKYEQKCSGLIVATGAGSTGWYYYASGDHYFPNKSWPPTEGKARFIVTEHFEPRTHYETNGFIAKGEDIIIHSLNDNDGHVSVDGWDSFGFQRGSSVRIYIDEPLQVLVPNKE